MRIDFVGGLVALLFASVVGVNLIMLTQAAQSYSGLLDKHPYSKGLSYDEDQRDRTRFRQSGWQVRLTSSPATVRILSADGTPLTGATVMLRAIRPDSVAMDREVTLVPSDPGVYVANDTLQDGRWMIDLVVTHEGVTGRVTSQVEIAAARGINF